MTIVGTVLAVLLLPVAVVWVLPLASELVSLVRAASRGRAAGPQASARQRLLFLVPAHDEGEMIAPCVRSLLAMRHDRTDYDVAFIADNCSDDTAAVVRREGGRALERNDTSRRGKPHAIAWAMAQHDLDAYDAVVIIDADTIVVPEFAEELAATGPLRERAVQAYNGGSNDEETWLTMLSGLLSKVRYEGQYPLKQRAGLIVPLTGDGMCMGTGYLKRVPWPPESLTENWDMYARSVIAGESVGLAHKARLGAYGASTLAQSGTQRRRWQAGRQNVLKAYWRAVLATPKVSARQKLDTLAELVSPGPVMHAVVGAVGAVLLLLLPGAVAHAVGAVFLASLLPIVGWTVVAWLRSPHRARMALAMLALPVYAAWRCVMFVLAFSTGRRRVWQRSPRPASGAA